jgi:hypothetical protein
MKKSLLCAAAVAALFLSVPARAQDDAAAKTVTSTKPAAHHTLKGPSKARPPQRYNGKGYLARQRQMMEDRDKEEAAKEQQTPHRHGRSFKQKQQQKQQKASD